MRILVLDSGNSSSYHLMRTLTRAGHEVHISSPEDSLWARSKYCARSFRSPPATDRARYLRFLLELTGDHSYSLLLFCGDDEAEVIWSHRDEIERRVACFLPGTEVRPVAFSKNEAYRHAARVGVPIPRTAIPKSRRQLTTIAEQIGLPAIVKGERGSAGSRVRYVRSIEELTSAYEEIREMELGESGRPSVQEYVDGPGFVVHALFHRGEPHAICSHRKEREYPVRGGVTSSATTVHYPELDRVALRFLRSLRWNGLAKLDFKLDLAEEQFKFIEIDPRVSASIDIARVAGVDQVRMLCDLAARQRVEPQLGYRAGVHYRWLFPRDVLAVLAKPADLPAFTLDFFERESHRDLGLLDDPRVGLRAMRILFWYMRRDLRRLREARANGSR